MLFRSTTHFSIMDTEGNMVAATLTVNTPFGSKFMVEGTGFVLNNEMDDFSAKPAAPNAYGLIGFKANEIQPDKRPLSSMSPTLMIGEDKAAVVGTPGGSRIITMVLLLVGFVGPSFGYRDYFTPEQKQKLADIQTVLVDVIALTDKGKIDASAIQDLVVSRMEDLGYSVVTNSSDPHDVVFRVKCEQYKTWEGTTPKGGDADLPDSPARLWKGPACQITYVLGSQKVKWQKEVRTEFEDAVLAARAGVVCRALPEAGRYWFGGE